MGQITKKRPQPGGSGGESLALSETIYWALKEFGWTYTYLCSVPLDDFNYIIEGSVHNAKRQEREYKRSASKVGGRQSIDSIDQLIKTPGITKRDITKKKR